VLVLDYGWHEFGISLDARDSALAYVFTMCAMPCSSPLLVVDFLLLTYSDLGS
jgi:hypothetical protein